MIKETEYLSFINEIGRLFNDYYKCHDEKIKQILLDDIRLIGQALH
ncbi:hypothetical protein DFO73_106292 [Cytobacillus oceanisediminis]|jgi:hypothetical protein|uniref:Uncharacterized protein n=1 Tax=Cytobacillus oceanisediminis TaxID=665099 RepID=A0A2V2ZVK9_9BACI|nr:hypothetical protein [Cytobacillus oceanisediminis]PWW28476.1 hypothetical protein DFO73_106292 [Cytobacillus oceanisediminis]